jgi:hypothetical protein
VLFRSSVVGINIHSTSLLSAEEEWSTHYQIRKPVTIKYHYVFRITWFAEASPNILSNSCNSLVNKWHGHMESDVKHHCSFQYNPECLVFQIMLIYLFSVLAL